MLDPRFTILYASGVRCYKAIGDNYAMRSKKTNPAAKPEPATSSLSSATRSMLALAAPAILAACSAPPPPAAPPAAPVVTATAQRKSMADLLGAVGSVE